MAAPVPKILRDHPEYEPVFHWHGWMEKQHYARRLAMTEVAWALRHKGPIGDTMNAPERLRDRMVAMGSVTIDRLTPLGLSVMLKEMAGQDDKRGLTHPFIGRECHGKRTRRLWPLSGVELPPDPYALARAHRGGKPVPETEDDPIARVKALSDAIKAEELADQLPVVSPLLNGSGSRPEPEPEPEPDERRSPGPHAVVAAARAVERQVEAVATVSASLPVLSGDESLAEKALVLMRLAGEVYTESLVRAAVTQVHTAAEPVEPVVPVVDRDEQAERLGAAMEEIRRLRKRMQDERLEVDKARASAAAAQAALNGERVRREMAEANLEAIAKADRVPDESGFRELRKTMQERPRENPRIPVSA